MADGNGAETPKVSPRALFEAYDTARGKVAEATFLLHKATKTIVEACGQGPFMWGGQEITMVKRGEIYIARVKARKAQEVI